MTYDESKIEDAVLALLTAFRFDSGRAWKGFEFNAMDRLHAQDVIENPAGKNRSPPLNSRVTNRTDSGWSPPAAPSQQRSGTPFSWVAR
jgi:hypothetical protein